MPRRARKDLNTSFFHIIVQGLNKEFIFKNNKYKDQYLQLMKKFKKDSDINIISYCIMSNHTHLLLHTENITELSSFMKNINESFARYYNEKENRVGYVFKNRFLSESITNQKYLLNCISYIHKNPVKANLVQECGAYKYSSYNDYIYKKGFVNSEICELVFGKRYIDVEEFKKMHSNKLYYFKEYDDMTKENMQEIILEFESKYQKKWSEIIAEPENLENIIKEIKERMQIANITLAKYLKISRNKVDRIIKKT